ncbi:hypothetical protein CA600_12925 [Paenibacillus sp. VTT E-133280]|jgi:hypothetical protein|uniref:hypothetical protein n=1 Tax=Paenibacillus TaxID=44249 RepID=UPI000BA0FCCF|nr:MULTISPECIES: hypothetical protein [unclassified Paenibacillus]MDH6371344.1 hypothetical protein [Paenibacillus sp. PastF-3]OZQ65924.1 hypothetical protein CA600_12925 [Paenibacillus sp. VTT E-133280]OZQ92729.1 hypothetical protein CA598_10755 [Paenibacillus sp. VTT E-133291]
MQGIAKAVLLTILTSVTILLFVNLAFFFPWYLTLVTETYSVSQIVAGDNYLKESYYEDAMERLQERPIYRDKADDISITVTNVDQDDAIGNDDETSYYEWNEMNKPYRQRGEPLTVEIKAVYPFSITLWGKKLEREIPVQFSMSTTGLKHYKDLDYYMD